MKFGKHANLTLTGDNSFILFKKQKRSERYEYIEREIEGYKDI